MAGKYLKIKCKCGNEQIIYSHTTHKVDCTACKEVLAEPQGGTANILGKIVEELD
jgi:small subunit ribosomal protein S27e